MQYPGLPVCEFRFPRSMGFGKPVGSFIPGGRLTGLRLKLTVDVIGSNPLGSEKFIGLFAAYL